jgi:hypothetical protein
VLLELDWNQYGLLLLYDGMSFFALLRFAGSKAFGSAAGAANRELFNVKEQQTMSAVPRYDPRL